MFKIITGNRCQDSRLVDFMTLALCGLKLIRGFRVNLFRASRVNDFNSCYDFVNLPVYFMLANVSNTRTTLNFIF